jgi:glyoxylase-like metal-dependent hydrolase (beta-lactamase superfamily II)
MPSLPPEVQPLDHGVHVIDTGFHRPGFDASYLLVENRRAAFVDTGANSAIPRLMAALAGAGLAPEAVDFVIATHVHLDHAGGVGSLMPLLPAARLVVHPRGAPHLVDPRLLVRSASSVYGAEEFKRSYGTIVPVPRDRIIETRDDGEISLAGRRLKFLHTPGHARHHHCIWDARSRGFFTGDTFGLSYREFDTAQGAWLLPTTTPVQFDPDALRASVHRLLEHDPECMYLTHFGRVTQVPWLGQQFFEQLSATVALGIALKDHEDRHEMLKRGLTELYWRRVQQHACAMERDRMVELLALDIELNAQGMGIWLDRSQQPEPQGQQQDTSNMARARRA